MVAPIKEVTWLILGGDGQLGQAMGAELLKADIKYLSLNHQQLDITSQRDIEMWFTKISPDIILNSAAWTDVDLAESKESKARLVNAIGPKLLAGAASEIGAKFVHISTDFVFSGNSERAWPEDSVVSPISAYGRTKAEGERLVLDLYPKGSYVVRTAWLYSPWGKNFVRTILKLAMEETRSIKVITDMVGQPTSATDLATQIREMIVKGLTPGIYHGTNRGQASWFEFAKEILNLTGHDSSRVIPIKSKHLPRPARRPTHSVLDDHHWSQEGMNSMLDWQDALKVALPAILQNLNSGQ